MSILDMFRRAEPKAGPTDPILAMAGEMASFSGLGDPELYEFMRQGGSGLTESGSKVTVKTAMKNTTVLRCVSLISFSIGMLPLHLQLRGSKQNANDHPLYKVLHRKPNTWQTAFEFRSLMQQWALQHGDAFARILWSGSRVTGLVPMSPAKVTVKQRDDWSLEYKYDRGRNGSITLSQRDVFHLRFGLSDDGFTGLSQVRQAAEAIGLAQQGERAAARLFRNGMIVGGALKHKGRLSPEAYERLKASLEEDRGAESAHKWKILEEGMEMDSVPTSGRDNQGIENRSHQVEEIARAFGGVPRPLLNMDDTSWGSGIDVLGQLFVRFTLNAWFEAWQQAIERDLLSDPEIEKYEAKFNPGGLLRGSMTDQADFFAKALGSGGHQPWMDYGEVRETMDLPEKEIEPNPIARGGNNEPAETT